VDSEKEIIKVESKMERLNKIESTCVDSINKPITEWLDYDAEILFYFISEAPNASQSSGAGGLLFPGNDSRGFALYRGSSFLLEDNSGSDPIAGFFRQQAL